MSAKVELDELFDYIREREEDLKRGNDSKEYDLVKCAKLAELSKLESHLRKLHIRMRNMELLQICEKYDGNDLEG